MYCPFGLCALSVIFSESGCANFEMMQFGKFMQKFRKIYESSQEYEYRLSVFSKNMKEAVRLQREELGTAQYGVTQFSDLTAEEFRTNNLNIAMKLPHIKQKTAVTSFPRDKDWRKNGVISEVKNQGNCNSCWAFAAVGNIEAQWGIQGCPRNLSVQRGLVSEEKYKYQAVRKDCRKGLSPAAWIHDFQMLPKNETVMTSYVGNDGTLTVIINNALLQHYIKGIIHNVHKSCDPVNVNHVVLIVGYVRETKIPYWIVKNSYGTGRGEKGYFRMFHGKNMCGITKYPLAAIVNFKKSKTIPCPPKGNI